MIRMGQKLGHEVGLRAGESHSGFLNKGSTAIFAFQKDCSGCPVEGG